MRNIKSMVFALIAVCVCASSAQASLHNGTWYSNSGEDRIELGTWLETYAGDFPYFLGSHGTATSSGGQWSADGYRIEGVSFSGFQPFGSYYYCDVVVLTSRDWEIDLFGDAFTSTAAETLSYRAWYYTPYHNLNMYIGSTNITYVGQGVINEYPGYTMSYRANATMTGGSKVDFSSWGDITYAELTIVPIPAGFLLLGSGLLGIFGIRRRFVSPI